MKKFLALFISILLLLPIVISCADTPDSKGNDSETTTITEEITEGDPFELRKAIPDNLPGDSFDGYIFTILARDRDDFVKDIGAGVEATGDVIVDAIYARNTIIEERFDIEIESYHTSDPISALRKSIGSDDDTYSLMMGQVIETGSAVLEGSYVDWYNDLPYVNMDQPWYIGNAVDALSIENHAYMMAGEYCLSILRFTYCMYYNKLIAEDYNIYDLYSIVMKGEWTIDKLDDIVKIVHEDLDGNGVMDTTDKWGFTSDYYSAAITYQYAFNNPVMTKNSKGVPEVTYNNGKMPDIVNRLYTFFYENEGSIVDTWGVSGPIWTAGNVLFLNGLFSSAESYRSYDFDFGIIPYPKWDTAQTNYYTMSDGAHDIMAVPKTIRDGERTSIIIEALNAESYKQVIPSYYETALKVKFTRDNESILVLDMLLESRTFDFGYVYDGWQGFAFILQDLMSTKKTSFASSYAAKEKSGNKRYNKVIDTLLGLN